MNSGHSGVYGKSVVLISTVPFFLVNQLSSHIENLKRLGARVTLVSSGGEELSAFIRDKDIQVEVIEIARSIRPWKDLKALCTLTQLFRKKNFSIMHSTTPKAGLLSALASKMVGIPVRLHTFTGQVWATKTGLMCWFLQQMDRLIIHLNTHCYTDSPSQREFLVEQGVALKNEISVIGQGSLGGVDVERFSMARWSLDEKQALCKQLGIADADIVIIYIGRITKDKGIGELLEAFSVFQQQNHATHLLLLGPTDQDGGELSEGAVHQQHVHCLGYVRDPERYLAISDALCLPSYREGFGTVVIEAAAMGVPTIGTAIPGLVDAVEHGVTGLLVPPQDVSALVKAIESVVFDRDMLKRMSAAAIARCNQKFDSKTINNLVVAEYVQWLGYIHE